MSGIAGVVDFQRRPVERGVLKTMLGGISHRGPDRSAQWSGEGIAMGHTMLCTTPESLV